MKRFVALLAAVAGWALLSAGGVAVADESGTSEPTDVIIIECPVGTDDVPTDSGSGGGTDGATDTAPATEVTDDPIASDSEIPPETETVIEVPVTDTTETDVVDPTETSVPTDDVTSTVVCAEVGGAAEGDPNSPQGGLAFGGDETMTQLLIAVLLIAFGAVITYFGRGVARHARYRR